MPRPHVDLYALTPMEREAAVHIVMTLAARLTLKRSQAVLRALGSGESLLREVSISEIQGALRMHSSSLLRNERQLAVAAELALRIALSDDASAERVITYLAQRNAVMELLLDAAAKYHGALRNVVTEEVLRN
jgi:hypothetical protein